METKYEKWLAKRNEIDKTIQQEAALSRMTKKRVIQKYDDHGTERSVFYSYLIGVQYMSAYYVNHEPVEVECYRNLGITTVPEIYIFNDKDDCLACVEKIGAQNLLDFWFFAYDPNKEYKYGK